MKTRAQANNNPEPAQADPVELQALRAHFEKPPKVRRRPISKKKPRRHNRKVDEYHMERILILRDEHGYTYKAISRKLNMPTQTVYMALKRYKQRQNEHVDNRRLNGRRTPRKITAPIEAFLLRQATLQQQSGWTLD